MGRISVTHYSVSNSYLLHNRRTKMRFTLCILVLLLLAITLAFPDIDGYRKKGKNKNKKNKKGKEEEPAAQEDEDDGITKLKCVSGYIGQAKSDLKSCETELSNNCMKVYIADNPLLALDTSHFLYTCVRPGVDCDKMAGYLASAPAGSYCQECDRKFNGCNVEGQTEIYEEVFGKKKLEE